MGSWIWRFIQTVKARFDYGGIFICLTVCMLIWPVWASRGVWVRFRGGGDGCTAAAARGHGREQQGGGLLGSLQRWEPEPWPGAARSWRRRGATGRPSAGAGSASTCTSPSSAASSPTPPSYRVHYWEVCQEEIEVEAQSSPSIRTSIQTGMGCHSGVSLQMWSMGLWRSCCCSTSTPAPSYCNQGDVSDSRQIPRLGTSGFVRKEGCNAGDLVG